MPVAGIVTLIGVAATVVVLAGYLIAIVFILKHVTFTLGTVIAGVRSIALQTQPLASVVGEINRDLTEVQRALEGVLVRAAQKSPGRGRR